MGKVPLSQEMGDFTVQHVPFYKENAAYPKKEGEKTKRRKIAWINILYYVSRKAIITMVKNAPFHLCQAIAKLMII